MITGCSRFVQARLDAIAYYFTSLYSYRKLADAVGTNENTVKAYLSYFEKAYLFFSVDFFEYSLKKQFRRNKKIYVVDCGIRHSTPFSFSEDSGRYVENIVFQKLRRMTDKVYYWSADKGGHEIDFIVQQQNRLCAVNVTYTDKIPQREFDAFLDFSKVASAERNILVTKNIFKKKKIDGLTVEMIPLWVFIFFSL